MSLNESIVEDAAPEWYWDMGYAVGNGPLHFQFYTLATLRDTLASRVLCCVGGSLGSKGVLYE